MANFSLFITYLSFFSLVSKLSHGFNPKLLNVSKAYQPDDSGYGWSTTRATWYGGPNSAGSDGGACGYADAVDSAPFSSLITAVAPSLFNLGCGRCYQVKCTSSEFCSGKPVTVVATDSCQGCDHLFDLSGTSFGAMSKDGDANKLRDVGNLEVQYTSVECDFGVPVTFRVQPGSNPSYLALMVEFEDGHGVSGVAIRQANSTGDWLPMTPSWGAVYKVDLPSGSKAPFSIQLTDGSQTIVADHVIPENYKTGELYKSTVNFKV